MKRLPAGRAAEFELAPAAMSGELPGDWRSIVSTVAAGRTLRPVQIQALEQARVLESRKHIVVCAPTNSGKSLIGHLLLIEAVRQGRRAVLLEPLRALAQEQAEELSTILAALVPTTFEQQPLVRLSTGDYRLEDELPTDAPPEGEVVVATPERFDALLRNPDHVGWVSSIGAVVIDEAHLVGDPRRGPTLELIAASMLTLPKPPRLALLSATVGEPERLREWLHPCELISSPYRTPHVREVWQLEQNEDPDHLLAAELADVLLDESAAAIVFVYQRRAAERLAAKLTTETGSVSRAYHSGQSQGERRRLRAEYEAGEIRCLVSTTALAMGVNLPATHVYVRDTTFFGSGKLSVAELLQIMGRAGRGDRPGFSTVLLIGQDDWGPTDLADALRTESLPPLRSSFEVELDIRGRHRGSADVRDLAAATLIAACLGRASSEGLSTDQISDLLRRTLGARSIVNRVHRSLAWLSDPARALAYTDAGGIHHLTSLGRQGVRSVLPLPYVAGLGQLVRDLMSLEHSTLTLARWTSLDHLFVVALLSDRVPRLRRFSESLAEQIDGWHESRAATDKSLLFGRWVAGSSAGAQVDELLGSLRLAGNQTSRSTNARATAYSAMLAAIALDERSHGCSIGDLEDRWRLADFAGIEESWRDTAIWLLSGHLMLFELPNFYHHLLERCGASPADVTAVKKTFQQTRSQVYDVLDRLKYCSPLGPLAHGVRQTRGSVRGPIVGEATIRLLEQAGLSSLEDVAAMTVEELAALGVQPRFARQINAYLRRRQR
jgi:helicase